MQTLRLFLAILFSVMSAQVFATGDLMSLEHYTKLPAYRNVQISPDGKHLSVVFKRNGVDMLAILDKATLSPLKAFKARGSGKGIGRVDWVSDDRLVYSLTKYKSWDKQVYDTGELVGVNVDGKRHELIFGFNAGQQQAGSNIKRRKASYGHHRIIDLLEEDKEHVLIAFYKWKVVGNYWKADHDAKPKILKLNFYSGKTKKLDVLPYPMANAITDNEGNVRFAVSIDKNNDYVISYKTSKTSKWRDFSPSNFEGVKPYPISFSANNREVYLAANVGNGTRALYVFNLEDNSFEKVFHDEIVDISEYVHDFAGRRVVVVATSLAKPVYHYLDESDSKARLHKMLAKAFEGFDFSITSITEDRTEAIVHVYSDFNPGDFYLFNTKTNRADFLLTGRPWIDLKHLLPMQPMEFTMRDSAQVHGYVTFPEGDRKNLPLVVLPHGGPHGVRDHWGFDWESQLLASRGYAVLQLNFRGSGGYGVDFEEAGYGKWGTLMQDDVTDATLALIEQGVADSERICIFGASYGGYAALMGAAREPELYQCAIGSVGVYNLPMMFKEGDISEMESGLAFLQEVLGDDVEDQKRRSPVYNADKIKADVFLIHGAQDVRAPIEQAESLMAAFDDIGKEYDWLKLKNEGHGYYDEENRVRVYSRVLEFLEKHIGD